MRGATRRWISLPFSRSSICESRHSYSKSRALLTCAGTASSTSTMKNLMPSKRPGVLVALPARERICSR